MCLRERWTHRDRRLGRSHGASSGSLSSWLFCSILKVTHGWFSYRCNTSWSVCGLHEGTSGRTNNSIARGNLTQGGKGQWKLEEKQRMWRVERNEKEKLLGWAADVILRRMEQKARRKWGANNSPLSFLSLPRFLRLSLLLSLKFLSLTVVWQWHTRRLPLSWHHGATILSLWV